jgi:tripartite-type tricarboxylate transporter receptor subunit TctC
MRRLILAALLAVTPAVAQEWRPESPITLISPYSPGATDVMMRMLGEYWHSQTGANVVVVNRDGGSGVVGMRALAASAPDGRTLALTPMTAITVQPHMVRNLGIGPANFAPICGTHENIIGVVVRADSPIRSMAELVAAGRQRNLTFGSAGPNSLPFLGVWRVSKATGVDFTHLPFRGDPPHLNETLAGRLDFSTTVVSSASEFILSGRMRLLGVFSENRHPDFPEVPTMREQGIDALQFSQVGIYAPAGTPENVLNRLEELCRDGMRQEAVTRVARNARMVVRYVPRREFTAFVQSEYEAYREILRQLGVQPE